ncbi:MAG: hypothetical protein ACC628_05920 [Pirellulaceae bacterium]
MTHMILKLLMALLLAVPAFAAVEGESKKPYDDRSDDVSRDRVETVTTRRHEYSIEFAGTLDGTMTRMPIGYAAYVQGWQPNRSVLIENVGEADVSNPWLVVNGRGDWRTLASIAGEATRGYSTEADQARSVWEFVRRQRFHACTWDGECSDALKALNVYGYTLCGNQARVLDDLWRAAGLKTRRCFPIGHVVGEVLYDGRYHMMDSDEHVICLLRDNQTIASGEDIVRDHDLVKRTHTYGIGQGDARHSDEFSASLYSYEGERGSEFGQASNHSMDLVLRPGESLELRWDHIGKQYTAGVALKKGQKRKDGLGDLLAGLGTTAYDNMRNGKLRYRPDLAKAWARHGAVNSENTDWDQHAGQLRPIDAAQPAKITWHFRSPYVFVGGMAAIDVQHDGDGQLQWHYSVDGQKWTPLESTGKGASGDRVIACLDDIISPRRQPTYRFWLQLTLQGRVAVSHVAFEHDIQTAALNLPELTVGANRVVYSDDTPGDRKVRITHRWLERTCWHPPDPPSTAVAPQEGATVEGTQVAFAWSGTSDPDGDAIADYRFELSAHPDMRWPLSPNFEKRISLTDSRGTATWAVPCAGLLNPDTTYYWRVKAMDARGVWGAWSSPFSFQVRAPGVPLDLKLVPDEQGGRTLTWRPNPKGRRPVVYKVYGSDERGFSISDQDYTVVRGKGFVHTIDEFDAKPSDAPDAGRVVTPANLITQTAETACPVVGPDVELANTNKAFYRVIAVDAAGQQSGPSDYVEVARPFVYTRGKTTAKVGQRYTYLPGVIRSLGDLRCRHSPTSSYNAAFWDREEVTFKAIRLPAGLSLDPESGQIDGTLKTPGDGEIIFEVSLGSDRRVKVTQPLRVIE